MNGNCVNPPLMPRRRWPINVFEQEKADLLLCRHVRVSRLNRTFTADAAEHRDQHKLSSRNLLTVVIVKS